MSEGRYINVSLCGAGPMPGKRQAGADGGRDGGLMPVPAKAPREHSQGRDIG